MKRDGSVSVVCLYGLVIIVGISNEGGWSRYWDVWWSQSKQPTQILYSRDQQKLFRRAGQASKFESGETKLLLHVPKQHLDFLSKPLGATESVGVLLGNDLLPDGVIKGH